MVQFGGGPRSGLCLTRFSPEGPSCRLWFLSRIHLSITRVPPANWRPTGQRSAFVRTLHDLAKNRDAIGFSLLLVRQASVVDLPKPVFQPLLRVWYETARIVQIHFESLKASLKACQVV